MQRNDVATLNRSIHHFSISVAYLQYFLISLYSVLYDHQFLSIHQHSYFYSSFSKEISSFSVTFLFVSYWLETARQSFLSIHA